MTKHKRWIFRVTPFSKLQNSTWTTVKQWKMRCRLPAWFWFSCFVVLFPCPLLGRTLAWEWNRSDVVNIVWRKNYMWQKSDGEKVLRVLFLGVVFLWGVRSHSHTALFWDAGCLWLGCTPWSAVSYEMWMCSHRPKATHLQKSLCAHDSQLGADKRQVCIFASLESASIGQFDTTVLQVMNEMYISLPMNLSLGPTNVRCGMHENVRMESYEVMSKMQLDSFE